MAINALGSVSVALSLFSSLDTELSPSDIPEGISPDNQDVVYTPGEVRTRPSLQRIFPNILDAGRIVYEKSFVTPSGDIKNLYLSSSGTMWVEDVTNSPGTATSLFTTLAPTAQSVTAEGREYIMLSDGIHGYDVPLSYDGALVQRLTQDGPGAPPTVTSLSLPTFSLSPSTSGTAAIVSIQTTDLHLVSGGGSYYQTFTVTLAVPQTLIAGNSVTISGNSGPFNGVWPVAEVIDSTHYKVTSYSSTFFSGTGGSSATPAVTLVRSGNTVTAYLSVAPESLQVGYQVLIAGVPASQIGGGIASVVVNNEDLPGIATITTNQPHGLAPQNVVFLDQIPPNILAIASYSYNNFIVNITTSTPHGLSVGSQVLTALGGSGLLDPTTVQDVLSPTTFVASTLTPGTFTGSGGQVQYVFPLANAFGTPTTPATLNDDAFEVVAAPTPTSFQVAFTYTDGTWFGGTVSSAWDGTFYVTGLDPATNSVQYQQYGPNASTNSSGSLTPYGQASPGIHQVQVCGILPGGVITEPSPPASFTANGGQYISVSNIAIGPNWIGRILLFTGSGGAYFFYIPVPAQVNGLVVSTATQINDNTTTNIVLDFSDNTLYAGIGCSVPGNNLVEQVVIGPSAGVFTYSSRLMTWGDWNKIENMLNMGFDGGYLPSAPTIPSGWTSTASGGALGAGRFGGGNWQINTGVGPGALQQSFYADAYGDPIAEVNTLYMIRVYLQGAGTFQATISSVLTGFSATATIVFANTGWYTAAFTAETPATIPIDMLLSIAGTAGTFTVDELSVIFSDQPYHNFEAHFSYEDNLEGFDGLTGIAGPEDDESAIHNWGVIRDTLYCSTAQSLHETSDNGTTEPSNWGFRHVADNCGSWSIASIARNVQGIGSAGKEWMIWSGPDGVQIFTGQQPQKVSQEIESIWQSVDQTQAQLCWSANDQVQKRCYFGYPNQGMKMVVLDYRNLDGEGIAQSPPIHISFTGKMIASDLTRKWTRWNVAMNCGALIYRPNQVAPQIVFGGGAVGSNAYTLLTSAAYPPDDDFGTIASYYTTYFFVSHEAEQALQVDSYEKLYGYGKTYINGVGYYNVTPLGASLANAFPSTPNQVLDPDQFYDLEFGLNVQTSRCAFKVQAFPLLGSLAAGFSLQKMVISMKPAPWAKVRGTNTGAY